ncbi:hypothetical protein [Brevibacillus laterosporus]
MVMVFLSTGTFLFVTNWLISYDGNPTSLIPVFILYLVILLKLLEKKDMTND